MEQTIFGKVQQLKQAVIYLRVSTEEQVDNYSLETQEDICTKEAQRRGLTIAETFREEGKSAKNIQGRPALIQLLEYCRKHKREIDSVIIYRLDRISRQTADYLAIRKKLAECEIKLISATEPTGNSPTEKFVETMLAGFAQMDNDVRSERSKNGLRARFQAGLSNGQVPIGYLPQNGYTIKDPETFEKMKAGWELMLTGTKTLKEMANILSEQGLRGGHKGGKEYMLRAQTLNRIFRNKFYMGKVTSPKYNLEIQGQHTPMITEEQFYRVQAILDGRNTNIATPLARRNRDNPEFRLRRLVKCEICGSSFTGGYCRGKTSVRYPYYFCPKRCGTPTSVARDTLEKFTREYLDSIALTPKTIELFIAFLRTTYHQRIATLQKRLDTAESELKKLYEFRQALIQKNLSGVYSDEIFKEQNAMVEEKIQLVHAAKHEDVITNYNLEKIIEFIKSKLAFLSQTFEESSLDQVRMLLISINPAGLLWSYPGYLKSPISPFYKAILAIQNDDDAFGSANGSRTRDFWDENPAS